MATKRRRTSQMCKAYELKIVKSHLSKITRERLYKLFLEAKWFYNGLLARGDAWNADYKRKAVLVKNYQGSFETRNLEILPSQIRQAMVRQVRNSITSLSRLRENGHRVGSLKFKSRVLSIPLSQFNSTHKLRGNRIKIQNLKQWMRVSGVEQIPRNAEIANANLLQRAGNYFLRITTFQQKASQGVDGSIGIDFGIARQLTLSNGISISESVYPTRRVGRIHRELSRRAPQGRNRQKTELKLRKEYAKTANQRKDIRNKIVAKLTAQYTTICIQDDNIKAWQRMWGRRVEASAIGGIIRDFRRKTRTLVVVPRFRPTTKMCSRCGGSNEINLAERSYHCQHCDLLIDRDLNAATNILHEGVPTERREVTPGDMRTSTEILGYLNGIPKVSASLVVEPGSPRRFLSG